MRTCVPSLKITSGERTAAVLSREAEEDWGDKHGRPDDERRPVIVDNQPQGAITSRRRSCFGRRLRSAAPNLNGRPRPAAGSNQRSASPSYGG